MAEDQRATVYVGNLPLGITSQDLYAYLSTFGQIRSVTIPLDHITQLQRGFAFVEFDEREDALSAIDNYDKSDFMSRTIRIRRAKANQTKIDYHGPVWAKDEWLQNMQTQKIENQQQIKQHQEKNKQLGLPVYKNLQQKVNDKPIVYVQND